MTNKTFDLLIIFIDGTSTIIHDVETYGTITNDKLFYYLKNNLRSFIPIDAVRFIGKAKDYYE